MQNDTNFKDNADTIRERGTGDAVAFDGDDGGTA